MPPRNDSSVVFFASTPFNLFQAMAASFSECAGKHRILIYFDQPCGKTNTHIDILRQWSDAPFEEIHFLRTKTKNPLRQYLLRRKALHQIEQIIRRAQPQVVYAANDRRIEFIRAYHVLKSVCETPRCIYLDDGVMSYVPRRYSDTPLETLVKKVLYGFWYNRNKIMGTAHYFDEGIVAFPQFAHSYLQAIPLRASRGDLFSAGPARVFFSMLADSFGASEESIVKLKIIQILPHQYELEHYPDYFKSVKEMLLRIAGQGTAVGVKYHPHNHQDHLGLSGNRNIAILSGGMAFEIIVPLLAPSTVIVGDVSTVLLTVKWLRPHLRVISIVNPYDKRHNELVPLLRHLGVEIIDNPCSFAIGLATPSPVCEPPGK